MKKRIITLSILLVFVLSFMVYASGQWDTFVSKDEMTGEKIWYASSPSVGPTEKMGFPYGSIKARIGIGYDGEDEWGYVGFTEAPNLNDTSIEDGYNVIRTRIKWDDELESVELIQYWGSKFIHFRDDNTVVSNIAKSNAVLLELNWYGEGNVHFRFPLDGSVDAINKIHSAFDGQ
jgi:hypothetical protein